MPAYYNEIDNFAADWLANLITAGLIAPGIVDRRSIVDVRPDDLAGFDQCHFFAGIGGWSYALRLAGWPDDRPVWTGSCPCQPFSAAGKMGRFADERHVWPAWVRLIEERAPSVIFGEQVASATEWLRLVRGDLEALGYAVGAVPVEAASAGADHLRDRFWFVADRESKQVGSAGQSWQRGDVRCGVCDLLWGGQEWNDCPEPWCAVADAHDPRSQGRPAERERAVGADGVEHASRVGRREGRAEHEFWSGRDTAADASSTFEWVIGADGKARRVKPGVRLLVNGFPNRVGLLRGFGNAIDPRPARDFILASQEALAVIPSPQRGTGRGES